MDSLLGSFYSRIRGSQEDIASEGLVYVLQRSPLASSAIRRMVSQECGINLPSLHFRTQLAGVNRERPDISGMDEAMAERLIMEAKFWAALTPNQPVEYLARLTGPNGALLFLCPSLRVRLLWDELSRKIRNQGLQVIFDPQRHFATIGDNRYLFIKTWDQVLGLVKDAEMQEGNRALISDVDQIIGFCHKMDDIAFLPISEEDLSPALGKRIFSYYLLLDKVVDELRKIETVDLKGLKATAQIGGYSRYLRIQGFGLGLLLNFKYWYELAETPFYLRMSSCKTGDFVYSEEIIQACKKVGVQQDRNLFFVEGRPVFPLFPPLNEPEEMVVTQMAQDILQLIRGASDAMLEPKG